MGRVKISFQLNIFSRVVRVSFRLREKPLHAFENEKTLLGVLKGHYLKNANSSAFVGVTPVQFRELWFLKESEGREKSACKHYKKWNYETKSLNSRPSFLKRKIGS